MAATTRRLFALHLLVVLALVVAACGEPEEDVEDDVAEDAEEETAEVAGDLSLVITWSGSELEAFQAVVDGFESEHPDVDVSLIEIPFGELNAQLTQQFATGSPPDVTVALPGLIRLFAGQGFLMPLDDLWDEWVADGQYNDALREIASADGTAYGVWFKGNVNALIWYKPAQLEELGVEVPATWDEWIAGLDTIKDAGVEPFAVGGADPWPLTQWWDPVLVRVGGPEAFNGLIDGSDDLTCSDDPDVTWLPACSWW
jgi:alpha-glucoside transport system substrate-binding protein